MPKQDITVSWNDTTNGPTAPNVTIPSRNGATVIQWNGDSTIASIDGITGLPTDVFTSPQGKQGNAKVWTCTDRNQSPGGPYSYNISATKATNNQQGTHDPMITNGSSK